MAKIIEELSPELFTFDNYESDWWHVLSITLEQSADDSNPALIRALYDKGIGWCDGSRLTVRPRSDLVAFMCEDEGEKVWFHISKDTLAHLRKYQEKYQ